VNNNPEDSGHHDAPAGRRAILYLTWGPGQEEKVLASVRESTLPPYDVYWITDTPPISPLPDLEVVLAQYQGTSGCQPKSELGRYVPRGYDSYLYLDSDTRVLGNIDLGFELAEKTGLAMVPASAYSLANYMNTRELMRELGIPRKGQMIFNAGVMFFSSDPGVTALLETWEELAVRFRSTCKSDQVTLALAMELLGIQAAALSVNFNYRAYGERILGEVRIWHSRGPVPGNLNKHPEANREVFRGRIRSWSGRTRIRWPHFLWPQRNR